MKEIYEIVGDGNYTDRLVAQSPKDNYPYTLERKILYKQETVYNPQNIINLWDYTSEFLIFEAHTDEEFLFNLDPQRFPNRKYNISFRAHGPNGHKLGFPNKIIFNGELLENKEGKDWNYVPIKVDDELTVEISCAMGGTGDLISKTFFVSIDGYDMSGKVLDRINDSISGQEYKQEVFSGWISGLEVEVSGLHAQQDFDIFALSGYVDTEVIHRDILGGNKIVQDLTLEFANPVVYSEPGVTPKVPIYDINGDPILDLKASIKKNKGKVIIKKKLFSFLSGLDEAHTWNEWSGEIDIATQDELNSGLLWIGSISGELDKVSDHLDDVSGIAYKAFSGVDELNADLSVADTAIADLETYVEATSGDVSGLSYYVDNTFSTKVTRNADYKKLSGFIDDESNTRLNEDISLQGEINEAISGIKWIISGLRTAGIAGF
jgi:hypothetical protein